MAQQAHRHSDSKTNPQKITPKTTDMQSDHRYTVPNLRLYQNFMVHLFLIRTPFYALNMVIVEPSERLFKVLCDHDCLAELGFLFQLSSWVSSAFFAVNASLISSQTSFFPFTVNESINYMPINYDGSLMLQQNHKITKINYDG